MESLKTETIVTVFLLHRVLQFLTTAEYGIFPAAAIAVVHDMDLSDTELGCIGTVTYTGIAFSSFLSGTMFRKFGPLRVCLGCMILSVVGTILTMTAQYRDWLLAARFVSGFAHGPLYVYFPVWVDAFAPEGKGTAWMGMVAFVGCVGNLGSFATTAYLVYVLGWTWRYSFTHLAVGVAVMALGVTSVPAYAWTEREAPSSTMTAWLVCAKRPTFWCLAMISSLLWYATSALEYFGTLYFHEHFKSSPRMATSMYLMAGVGMGLGIVIGSVVPPYFGGYAKRKATFLYCGLMTGISLPVYPWLLNPGSPWECMVMTGFVLCCMSAIMPILTGLLLSTVPEYKTEASGLASCLMTAFGFMLGPVLVGYIADTQGIETAWFAIWIPVGLLPLLLLLGYVFDKPVPEALEEREGEAHQGLLEEAAPRHPEPLRSRSPRSARSASGSESGLFQ